VEMRWVVFAVTPPPTTAPAAFSFFVISAQRPGRGGGGVRRSDGDPPGGGRQRALGGGGGGGGGGSGGAPADGAGARDAEHGARERFGRHGSPAQLRKAGVRGEGGTARLWYCVKRGCVELVVTAVVAKTSRALAERGFRAPHCC
jgi:hypothetical protein